MSFFVDILDKCNTYVYIFCAWLQDKTYTFVDSEALYILEYYAVKYFNAHIMLIKSLIITN